MNNLYNYSLSKLEDHMLSIGQKKYRATQLFKWIYEKRVDDFDLMSDISLKFREDLKNNYCLIKPKFILSKSQAMEQSNYYLN